MATHCVEACTAAGEGSELSTCCTCRTTVAAGRRPACGRTLHLPCPCPSCSCQRARCSPCCLSAPRSHVAHTRAHLPALGMACRMGCHGAGGLVRASAGACARCGDRLARGCAGTAATCCASSSPCCTSRNSADLRAPERSFAQERPWPGGLGSTTKGRQDSCTTSWHMRVRERLKHGSSYSAFSGSFGV